MIGPLSSFQNRGASPNEKVRPHDRTIKRQEKTHEWVETISRREAGESSAHAGIPRYEGDSDSSARPRNATTFSIGRPRPSEGYSNTPHAPWRPQSERSTPRTDASLRTGRPGARNADAHERVWEVSLRVRDRGARHRPTKKGEASAGVDHPWKLLAHRANAHRPSIGEAVKASSSETPPPRIRWIRSEERADRMTYAARRPVGPGR
jgi:hypothetical protein